MIKKVSPYNLKKGILYLRHYGPKGFWIKLTERFQKSDIDYKEWYENHRPSEQELERERKQVFEYSPKDQHPGTGIQYTGGVFKSR